LQPIICVQIPKKRVRHIVPAEVTAPCLFDERQSSLSHSAQLRQHFFLAANHLGFKRGGGLATYDTPFDDHHGDMKSSIKRDRFGWFLQEFVGAAQNGPFNRA